MQPPLSAPPPSAPNETEPPKQYLQSLLGWRSHADPLPTELTPAAIEELAAFIRDQRRPATNAEVVSAVRRLRQHFGEWSQLTETEEAEVWRDWCLDFKSYPKAMLEEACAKWRNSTAKKPPTPGQLKDKVAKELERLVWAEWMIDRAKQAVGDSERRWRAP